MSKIERLAIFWIVGTTILAWILFLSAAFFGFVLGTWLVVLLTTILLGFFLKRIKKIFVGMQIPLPLIVFVLAWTILFAGLLKTRMLEVKNDGWYSGGSTWGDLALHVSFISKFSTQPTLDLTSPIYAQEETRYPFLFDFYTAQFVRWGVSIQHALLYTSLSVLVAAVILFYGIVLRLTQSSRAVWLASGLFFCNGGLGFWYFLKDFLESKQSFFTFVQNMPYNYAHIADIDLHFSNVVTDMFLPQRGIILGFGLFLVVLTLWQLANKNSKLWFVSSLIIGLIPMVHVHTFLLLFGCLIWLLGVASFRKELTLKQVVWAVLPALVLGGTQLWWMGIGTQSTHFVKIIHGWMEPKESLLIFWTKNVGLELFFLTLGSAIIFWKTKHRDNLVHLLPPLLFVFVVGNIVSLQPYVYDNIKLFFYVHLVVAFFSAQLLLWLTRYSRILAAVCFVLLTCSGVLSIVRESQVSWPIASDTDLDFAKHISESTPTTAIFLTADNHNHAIPMLSGRATILGYRGWLWTHGINYWQTEAEVRKIYAGEPEALELLKKYHVSYVVIGNEERQEYVVNNSFFYENFRVLFSQGERVVFTI